MLLEQQEKRKEIFHKEIEISPQNITITSLDEESFAFTIKASLSVRLYLANLWRQPYGWWKRIWKIRSSRLITCVMTWG